MTHKLRPFAFLLPALFLAAPAMAEGTPFERIEAACQKTLRQDFDASKVNKICVCVRKNYEAHELKPEELDLLVRSHEEDPAAEEEMQKEKWENAVLFDYDVTDGCAKKPTYRYP